MNFEWVKKELYHIKIVFKEKNRNLIDFFNGV